MVKKETRPDFKRTKWPKKLFLTLATSELALCSYCSKVCVLAWKQRKVLVIPVLCLEAKEMCGSEGLPACNQYKELIQCSEELSVSKYLKMGST